MVNEEVSWSDFVDLHIKRAEIVRCLTDVESIEKKYIERFLNWSGTPLPHHNGHRRKNQTRGTQSLVRAARCISIADELRTGGGADANKQWSHRCMIVGV